MQSPSYATTPIDLELECPPLPHTLLGAIEMMDLPEPPSPADVVRLVQHDPAATARVLRMVNSAYYSRRGDISDIHHAVVVLGPMPVVGIVMSLGMMNVRSAMEEVTALPFLNLVRHSIATAYVARYLWAQGHGEAAGERSGESFTAGMMHDFGKMLLLYNFPAAAARYYEAPAGPDWLEQEEAAFGYNHVDLGVHLAQKMHFPAMLSRVIRQHHAVLEDDAVAESDDALFLRVISAANRAVSSLGYAFNHVQTWKACCEAPFWDDLAVDLGCDRTALLDGILAERPRLAEYVDALS